MPCHLQPGQNPVHISALLSSDVSSDVSADVTGMNTDDVAAADASCPDVAPLTLPQQKDIFEVSALDSCSCFVFRAAAKADLLTILHRLEGESVRLASWH